MTLYVNPVDDLILDAFSRVVRRSGGLDCKGLSRDEADFCRVVWLEASVDNGGFASFFYNSYGDFTPETLEALSRIGASEAEQLLRLAMAVFGPDGPSRDQDARNEFIER